LSVVVGVKAHMGCSCSSDANIFMNDKYANYMVTFSREQLQDIFKKYDIDSDNLLELDELEKMILDMLDAVLKMQIAQLKGKRSLRPLLRGFERRIRKAKKDFKSNAKRLYKALDADKNGEVNKKEFFDFVERIQKEYKEGVLGMLAAGDDGYLIFTKKQYMAMKEKEGDLYASSAQAINRPEQPPKIMEKKSETTRNLVVTKEDIKLDTKDATEVKKPVEMKGSNETKTERVRVEEAEKKKVEGKNPEEIKKEESDKVKIKEVDEKSKEDSKLEPSSNAEAKNVGLNGQEADNKNEVSATREVAEGNSNHEEKIVGTITQSEGVQ